MPRVFLSNFDFEHELGGGGSLPRAARELAEDLAAVWLTVAQPGDWICSPGRGEVDGVSFGQPPSGPDFEFVPWGWSPRAVALARKHGWRIDAPPLDVVRRVNHRQFRFGLEQELGVAPAGSALVTSVEDAIAAVAAHSLAGTDQRWILKAGYGNSGREQRRGAGPLDAKSAAWVAQRLKKSGPLVFEPWLLKEAEAGLLWDVPRDGPPILMGIAPLWTKEDGSYLGSRLANSAQHADWLEAIATSQFVATRLQAEGYFGPLSIDAMRHQSRGVRALRPLQDLNGRWSMGRMALERSRKFPSGWSVSCRHFGWKGPLAKLDEMIEDLQDIARSRLRIVRQRAPELDPARDTHQVVVLLGSEDRELLDCAEESLLMSAALGQLRPKR
jgi:hypothetical protein